MKNALSISARDLPEPTKGKGSKDPDEKNRGELNGIHIDFSDNGCRVCCSFDPKHIDPKLSRYEQQPSDEKYDFNDPHKAAEYVSKMMLSAMEAEEEEETEEEKKAAKPEAKKEKKEDKKAA